MKYEKIKIYLNTEILSWTNNWIFGKSSDSLPKKKENQIPALETIYGKYSNYILLCVSMHTDSEMMNYNDKKRHTDPKILSLLNTINLLREKYQIDIKKKTSSICVIGHSRINMVRVSNRYGSRTLLYNKLKSRINAADAIHFVDAYDFKADVFLTVDYRTIINIRDEIQKIVRKFINIRIYDPDECLSYLNSKFNV